MTVLVVRNGWNGTSGGSPPNLTGQVGSMIALLDFCLVTGLGWTKTVIATNIATYKMVGGSGELLYVDDTGTTHARVRGMSTCTGITVGTWMNPYPTDAQLSGGGYFPKSNTADGTVRPWFFVGGPTFFHFFVYAYGSSNYNMYVMFGDLLSTRVGGQEVGCTLLQANETTSVGGNWGRGFFTSSVSWSLVPGSYMARPPTSFGGSMQVGRKIDYTRGDGRNETGSAGPTYPSPVEGGMIISKVFIGDVTYGVCAVTPGVYAPCHARPIPQFEQIVGAVGSDIAGKTLECVWGSYDGCVLVEISDTWDTVA